MELDLPNESGLGSDKVSNAISTSISNILTLRTALRKKKEGPSKADLVRRELFDLRQSIRRRNVRYTFDDDDYFDDEKDDYEEE
ncbi:hypothetical protein LguiB_017100 [Lonicera macranthoides]